MYKKIRVKNVRNYVKFVTIYILYLEYIFYILLYTESKEYHILLS